MSNDFFQFKKFSIRQDKTAMKVGTDSVLLGSWTRAENSVSMLDIGTGTGLLALMIAQRSNIEITAIEPEPNSFLQAVDNIKNSFWTERITLHNTTLQLFTTNTHQKFDLIICNPPFFKESLLSPVKQKNIARHELSLSIDELIIHSKYLLTESGKLNIILPYSRLSETETILNSNQLYIRRQCNVKSKPGLQPKRCLLEIGKNPLEYIIEELTIELKRHEYSEEYKDLTRSYYLKM